MAAGPLPFKGNTSARFNVETDEASKKSFSVQPGPISYRGRGTFGRSATNPDNVGASDPDSGHSSADR